jgi:hypothetical protein
VTKICESFAHGFARIGRTLDRQELSVLAVFEIAEVHGNAEIWRRFGGGSDRNRALLGNEDNSMHGMQIAQRLINTGDFVSY